MKSGCYKKNNRIIQIMKHFYMYVNTYIYNFKNKKEERLCITMKFHYI